MKRSPSIQYAAGNQSRWNQTCILKRIQTALPWNAVAPLVLVSWSCPALWRWLQRWARPPRPTSLYHKVEVAAHLIIPTKVNILKVMGAHGQDYWYRLKYIFPPWLILIIFVCQVVQGIPTSRAFRTFPMLPAPRPWGNLPPDHPLFPTSLTYLVVSSPLKNPWDTQCQDRWVLL